MPTVKQLRQQAKARKVPKYSSMNKASLLSALGMSNEAKQHKLSSGKSKAIEAQSKNIAKGDATKRAIVKGRLTRAIARELKKAGKDLTQDQKRQIALKAIATEAKKIREGKPEKQKPFGIQKPPHMSVAEYREHLRRKFDPNSSGSRVESIAKKEKQRSEIGSGEFEGRSTAENLRQMEQQGKVSYGKSGEQQSKPKTLGEGIKAYAEKVNELRRESARRGVSIALESDVLTHLKDQGYSQSQIKAIQGATDKLMGKISGRHGTVIHHDPDHPGFQKAIRDKTPLEKGDDQNQGRDVHIEDLSGKSAPKRAKARSTNSPSEQRKPTAGDKIRETADKIRTETEVQKKATARILGAAAQMAQNHDRLIDEVSSMVNEDLDSRRKKGNDSPSSPRQKLEAEAAKDPKLKQFLGLVVGKKLSDKQMREKLGVSQDELLQLGERSRKLLGITAMSTFKEGLARMYGDTGSKSRDTTPKSSPRLIEKTVDGRKRTFNRSGSEVVRGRSID